MASRREIQRLEDENRTVCQRLSSVEIELGRKEDELKAANLRKADLLNDLRESQRKVKDLKSHLEQAETSELEAKGSAHDLRQDLEHAVVSLRDQAASSKAAIGNFQLEIKNLKSKLSGKTDQFEAAVEQLQQKEDLLRSLQGERSKQDKDGSSRVANLNQALMQTKQACTQLTDENEALELREKQLLGKCAELEQACERLSAKCKSPCVACKERVNTTFLVQSPSRSVLRPCSTPVKAVPEETELDSLYIENSKLKQELQCIHTNFALTSHKSAQLKAEAKETEKSLSDVQCLMDQTLAEKEDLERRLGELKTSLRNKVDSQENEKDRNKKLSEEVASLQSTVATMQQESAALKEQLSAQLEYSQAEQSIVRKFESKIKALNENKDHLEQTVSEAQKKIIQLEDELAVFNRTRMLQSETEQRKSEAIVSFECKVSALKSEKVNLQRQLEEACSSNDLLHDETIALEAKNRSVQSQVNRIKAEKKKLATQSNEHSHLSDELKELEAKLVALSERCAALDLENTQLREGRRQFESQLHDVTKKSSTARREASYNWELVKKLQSELEALESKAMSAEEGLEAKETRCSQMCRELEALKCELSTMTIVKQKYEAEVGELMIKLDELEQNNFELVTKLSEVKIESSTSKLTQTEIQSRLVGAEDRFSAAQSTLIDKEVQITSLRCTNELMESENATLLSQVTSLSEMVATRNSKVESLQAQLVLYEQDTCEIAAKISELEGNHGACSQVKAQLQHKVDTLKEVLESARSNDKDTAMSILSLKLQVKQLEECNFGLDEINAGLQERASSEASRREQLTTELSSMEDRISLLEQDLKAKSSSLTASVQELEFVKHNSEDTQVSLKNEIESLEVKMRDLQELHEDIKLEKDTQALEISRLRCEIEDLKHYNTALTAEKDSLAAKSDQACSEAANLRDELFTAQTELRTTKSTAKYKKSEKKSEAKRSAFITKEDHMKVVEQYEMLKASALALLEPAGEENGPETPTKRKKLRGILKNADAVLKPVHNLFD